MLRACEPELLVHLPADDTPAKHSRRDLRRLNAWMGNARYMARALKPWLPNQGARILEIGAGEGTFFREVVRQLPQRGNVTLLDRQDLVTATTRQQLDGCGWQCETICADVFESLTRPTSQAEVPYHAIIANLFLHHFSDDHLKRLFQRCIAKAPLLIAIEPRRSRPALFAGKFVWAIGCNSVTRRDAIVSIRAGFAGRELSGLWPKDPSWTCEERPVGLWSHLFMARRVSPAG
jgi:hypothetical protein